MNEKMSASSNFFVNVPALRSFHYLAPNNHVLHTLAAKFFIEVFGNHPAVLRMPAILAGVLCMPLIFYVSRRLYGKGLGFVAVSLMAIFPVIILFDTQARGYSMLNFFMLAGIAIVLSIRDKPSLSKIFLLALNNALGLLTIPTFAFATTGLYIWVTIILLSDRSGLIPLIKRVLIPSGIFLLLLTLVFYTPVIISSQGLEKIITNPTVKTLPWLEFLQRTPLHLKNTFLNLQQGMNGFARILFFGSILLGISAILFKRKKLLLALIFSFIFGAAIIYFLKHSIPFARTWVYLSPLTFIVIDAGFFFISEYLKKRLQTTFLFILPVLVGLAAVQQMHSKSLIQFNDHGVFTEAEKISEYLFQDMRVGDKLHQKIISWPEFYVCL